MSTRMENSTATLRYAATPPTEEQIAHIRQILARRFNNKAIALETEQDETLAGGFVINYGNFEYDWSDSGRQSQLESGLIVSHDNFLRRRNPEENIISILKGRIEEFSLYAEAKEIGTVLEIGDGIATIKDVGNVNYGEIVIFDDLSDEDLVDICRISYKKLAERIFARYAFDLEDAYSEEKMVENAKREFEQQRHEISDARSAWAKIEKDIVSTVLENIASFA